MSRDEQIREAVDRCLARVRQHTDRELEALAGVLLELAAGDRQHDRADFMRAAVDVARAIAAGGAQASHDVVSRLTAAIRRIDQAASLHGILETLADSCAV